MALLSGAKFKVWTFLHKFDILDKTAIQTIEDVKCNTSEKLEKVSEEMRERDYSCIKTLYPTVLLFENGM